MAIVVVVAWMRSASAPCSVDQRALLMALVFLGSTQLVAALVQVLLVLRVGISLMLPACLEPHVHWIRVVMRIVSHTRAGKLGIPATAAPAMPVLSVTHKAQQRAC